MEKHCEFFCAKMEFSQPKMKKSLIFKENM